MKLNNDIDLYDINVWCNTEGVLTITAVELKEDGDNWQSNHAKTTHLDIPMDEENHAVVAYLLDNQNWQDQNWMEYDFWDTTNWLLEEESPFMLKVWARSLPYYTPEKVGA